ncbi:MAG: hypothetical protein KF904_18995 [Rhodoblastus sp.]|nr:hypothetical protein [Rhodoblastus sp.]
MADLTQADIDEILRLIDNSHFDELKLEIGGLKLEVRRRGATRSVAKAAEAMPAPAHNAANGAGSIEAKPSGAKPNGSAMPTNGHGADVPAPLLGTFFHAPKPGADPFVRVGDNVGTETVIGIIEVMKLMNSVTAGVAGVVTEIVAPNGELVEHGQTLIRIQPA